MTPKTRALRLFAMAACAAASSLSFPAFAAGSPDLVISQVYGGGGNSGATLKNDFIELFNRGSLPVSLAGLSVQYGSTTGNIGSGVTALPAVTLQPGQYFLIREAAGTGGTVDLPAPDAAGSIAMSATGGKVALVNVATSIACNSAATCPPGVILDLVGFGSATFFEGAAAAPALTNTTAALRNGSGCTDSDNNGADFAAAAPAPRNSASAAHLCDAAVPTPPSATASASPSTVSAGDTTTLTVAVTPGTNPLSTGLTVTADLSSIGGSAAQVFADDGTGNFSFVATVAGSPGVKTLAVAVSDAQGRGASASISLEVTAPVPHLAIHDIQGAGVFSPFGGQVVQTEGIVTGVKSNGFFIQAPDFEADADPNTSEGLFVFTSSRPGSAAAVGNRVSVRATVQDFIPASDPLSPPVTELSGSPAVAVLSSGNPLPAAVALGAADLDPAGSFSQLSKYEGMRVHVDALNVTAPTGGSVSEANATSSSNGTFYGVLPGTARPFREAGIEAPTAAPAGVPQFDGNPERLRVDSDGQVGATRLEVATGAVVSNLTGVLDFGFRVYTLLPDPGTAPDVANNDAHAIPVRAAAAEGEITVASFNMERFYDTVNDPGTSDVALTAAGFERRLAKASLVIRNVLRNPDVIGVEEMENLQTLQTVAARIDSDALAAGQTPPGYQAYLAEGNDIGGIDVGLLVKAGRIEVVSVEQLGKDATFVEPNGSTAMLNDRPPLVLIANVKRQGKELPFGVTVIVNHLRSLNGIDDPVDGPRVRAKRLAQAEYLANLINGYQLFGEQVISVGDYNAFDVNDGYVDVINTVRGGAPHPLEDVLGEPAQLVTTPLIDLAPADPQQHYSYVFDGNAQVLDHVIVSQSLTVTDFTYARNDADFPEVLRGDATRPERISDHDMPVAYFAVPRDTTPPTVTVTGVTEGATYLLGTVPATTCTTTDSGAGVQTPATLVVTGGDANGVGSLTATCTGAIDKVGNVAADVSMHYTVVAYTFGGFGAPLGNGPATARGGSTVPVKFQLFDWNGALITDTAAVTGVVVAADAGCDGNADGAWQAATAAGGTALRFDATENQFVFNWKTAGLGAGCYLLGVETVDTLTHAAEVVIR